MLHLERGEPHQEAAREGDHRAEAQSHLEGPAALAEDRHAVGAEGHEGAVGEGDLAGVAEGEIEADGEDEVDERQAGDVELVLLEPERHERQEHQEPHRQEAAGREWGAGHDAHSSFTPQIPSGFHRSTTIRIASTAASRNGPEM